MHKIVYFYKLKNHVYLERNEFDKISVFLLDYTTSNIIYK